jgi:hypothetical protein
MKFNVLFSSLMLCAVISASAQITITQDDFSNMNGVSVIQILDTTNLSAMTPGNAGANQSWDLSAIGDDSRDTVKFVNAAGVGCFSAFPTATYAMKVPGFDGFVYLSVTNSSLDMLGMCGVFMPPSITIAPYTPGYKKLTFPATMGTTFSGTTKQILQFGLENPPPDSARQVSTISYTAVADGWGTVKTPFGTYNALRIKNTETKVDSLYMKMVDTWTYAGLPPTTTVTTTYEWWVKNNFPVANMQINAAGQVTNASYNVISTSGVDDPTSGIPSTYIYPNPTSASFAVVNSYPAARTFLLVNLLGQTVFEAPIAGPKMEFSTETMTKGIYMTIIRDAKGETLSTGKLVVE